MSARESSLSRRLLLAAAVFIAIALVVAAIVIGFVLHRFIQGQIDQRLDTQIVFLTSLLRADGNQIRLAGNADGPPFERPHRGWYWQVTGPANALRSASLDGMTLDAPDHLPRAEPPPRNDKAKGKKDDRPAPGDGIGPDDARLHYRIKSVDVGPLKASIIVSAPRAAVLGPLSEAMTTLAVALAVLGLALLLAILLQVRLGLRPLDTLRRAVAGVRGGTAPRLPADQPREIAPLVSELNLMLDQNDANLERARRHVANLAHGLKTPLATLALAVRTQERRPEELSGLVGVMERRIRHHLGRARAAALGGPVRTRLVVAQRLADIGHALARIHADKPVNLTIALPDDLALAVEPQDFDEIAGNLLDNAFKWTSRAIVVRAVIVDRMATLTIEDDGPGIAAEQMPVVLRPGARLDETAPGFGFGLTIAREMAELYGGALDLSPAASGGLRVALTLPLATAL